MCQGRFTVSKLWSPYLRKLFFFPTSVTHVLCLGTHRHTHTHKSGLINAKSIACEHIKQNASPSSLKKIHCYPAQHIIVNLFSHKSFALCAVEFCLKKVKGHVLNFQLPWVSTVFVDSDAHLERIYLVFTTGQNMYCKNLSEFDNKNV